jgi:hypothetical protein
MTEYEQWLENRKKYGEFETEKQFWINQKQIDILKRCIKEHHKEWSAETGDVCREDCPKCALKELECPF